MTFDLIFLYIQVGIIAPPLTIQVTLELGRLPKFPASGFISTGEIIIVPSKNYSDD